MPTLMGTFVQSTYHVLATIVHISIISAVTGPDFDQTLKVGFGDQQQQHEQQQHEQHNKNNKKITTTTKITTKTKTTTTTTTIFISAITDPLFKQSCGKGFKQSAS